MYKLNLSPHITRISDSAFIPKDLANSDYQEYLAWIELGNTPIPAEVPLRETVVAKIWEAIKEKRDLVSGHSVQVSGNWYHSDTKSRLQQMGLVMMGAGLPTGLQWKKMDGTFITMTPTLAGQIFQATAYRDQQCFAVAESHKNSMSQAVDPALYDYSTGWPACYIQV